MFYDRNGFYLFTAFGVDVFVSLWYLILMAFIAFWPVLGSGPGGQNQAILYGLVFAAAVTLALLVHEYGHAAVCKYYGLEPSILLHGFGGLCMHREAASDGDDARVLFAGPGAGLIFGAVCLAVGWFTNPGAVDPLLGAFVWGLVWVNIVWSLFNLLLPIWPLDGGKLFHLLLRQFQSGSRARETALKVSIGTTVVVGGGLLALSFSLFLALLGVFILMTNLRMLRAGQPLVDRPTKTSEEPNEFQKDLLSDARSAMEAEDWDEAYRLCHQLRTSGGTLTETMLDEVWEILAVSTTALGKWDEADSYLERAPETEAVERARRRREEAASAGEEAA